MDTKYLKSADIKKIEEAMSCDDLEFMVATIDQIVKLRVAAAVKLERAGHHG